MNKEKSNTKLTTLFENCSFMLMGSCFSTEVGARMLQDGWNVTINPFGILFNPASICESIKRLESRQPFTPEDVMERDGQYCSFHHHGSFKRPTPEEFLANANNALTAGAEAFDRADTVILTLGTAWVFRHISRDIIVSNCHKVPAREFSRERLSIEEIVGMLSEVIGRHPKKNWLLTVSPIRHMADGLHGNQVSKSTLIMACDALCEKFANVEYFPSYEIMMDELRDHSWYVEGGNHPTPEAVDIIYSRLKDLVASTALFQPR